MDRGTLTIVWGVVKSWQSVMMPQIDGIVRMAKAVLDVSQRSAQGKTDVHRCASAAM